ncbi:syntaxin-81-like [Lactuca sativa]|uniref:syntaxin-81-like n=1 Tax=Lactuca sativa TaxID=4236 RepID=UPI001C6911C2|nr:syntaxin-81-like [Lactuca sativa]
MDYADPYLTTKEERDIIEHVVNAFVKPCKEYIGILQPAFDQLTTVRFQEAMPTIQQVLNDETCAFQVELSRLLDIVIGSTN